MAEKKGTKKPAPKKAAAPAKKAPTSPKAAAGKPASRPAAPAADKGRRKSKAPVVREPRPERQRPAAAAVDTRPPGIGIHDLRPAPGSTHYQKRVGRGPGSGHGKTAGRGSKGQKSRSGYRHQRGFEGGQMPLHRRVPKRGFTNIFRVEYDVINLSDLTGFEAGQAVTLETLVERRLARKSRPVKILGDGEIGKALTVSAHKFSASAQAKIEAAGGRCEVIQR
jgi:large subunit ribosomal protein L15